MATAGSVLAGGLLSLVHVCVSSIHLLCSCRPHVTMTDTQALMWETMSFDALSLCGHNWASLAPGQDSSATRRSPRLPGKAWGGGWEVLRKSHRGQAWERLGAGFLMEVA